MRALRKIFEAMLVVSIAAGFEMAVRAADSPARAQNCPC